MLSLGMPWISSWTVPWGEDPKTGALPWPHPLRSRCSCLSSSSCQARLPPLFLGSPCTLPSLRFAHLWPIPFPRAHPYPAWDPPCFSPACRVSLTPSL